MPRRLSTATPRGPANTRLRAERLLSELAFTVDGQPSSLDLGEHGDRLVWTGRLPVGGKAEFHIRYRARGLTVRWKGRTQAVVAAVPPPMEPVVTAARVQMVTTVEGRARMTVEYRLGLDREQSLGVKLPPDWALTRVSCNGGPRAVPAGREVSVAVAPESAGGRVGVVELTLERDFGVFHLSGRMNLALPGVSWPTSVIDASVHLPNVFEYRRLGGSLEPTDSAEWTPPNMPEKALRYRQHLVASAGPTIELRYAVDLENRYFRARR